MIKIFGRKLNHWAVIPAIIVGIVVNSAGAALDWWPASIWSVLPMLALAYAAGWLFGKPVEESSK